MQLAVLMGPPGSGKGTVSAGVMEHSAFIHLSTGAYIRKEMATPDSEIGEASRVYMDRSEFVPDEIALTLVNKILQRFDSEACLLFDGFPRTVVQGQVFDRLVKERGDQFKGAFSLEAPVAVLAKRLAGRRCCDSCGAVFNLNWNQPAEEGVCDRCGDELSQRIDDSEKNVKKRIELHREQTMDLIGYYETAGVLHRVDALRAPEESVKQILNTLNVD